MRSFYNVAHFCTKSLSGRAFRIFHKFQVININLCQSGSKEIECIRFYPFELLWNRKLLALRRHIKKLRNVILVFRNIKFIVSVHFACIHFMIPYPLIALRRFRIIRQHDIFPARHIQGFPISAGPNQIKAIQ